MKTLIALVLMTTAAHAAQCDHHDEVTGRLARLFGETVQIQALTDDGRMVEMTANPITGTWTAIATTANGMTCLLSSGKQYASVPPGDPA